MNIGLNEQRLLELLTGEYVSPHGLAKKSGMNWFIVFGTLCVLALEGKIDFLRLANKNYLFKKADGDGLL